SRSSTPPSLRPGQDRPGSTHRVAPGHAYTGDAVPPVGRGHDRAGRAARHGVNCVAGVGGGAGIMSPMSPSTARLLADIDSLPRPARMRLLADRARTLPAGELEPLLASLSEGDRFRRGIALFMAVVAGYQPVIMAARTEPVWPVRREAIGAWLRSCDVPAAEIAAFVADAPWHDRRHVYRILRGGSRAAVADALIDGVWRRFGDDEAARLLPACSPGTLARLLPELGYAAGAWLRLGERHPDVVLDVAAAQLAELTVPDRVGWWARFGDGVLTAGRDAPPRVLDLLERYAPSGYLPGPLRHYASLV